MEPIFSPKPGLGGAGGTGAGVGLVAGAGAGAGAEAEAEAEAEVGAGEAMTGDSVVVTWGWGMDAVGTDVPMGGVEAEDSAGLAAVLANEGCPLPSAALGLGATTVAGVSAAASAGAGMAGDAGGATRVSVPVWTGGSRAGGSNFGSDSSAGGAGGSGAGMMATGAGSAAGAGGGAADARCDICCSRYSAVILSSELDGTLAAEMPSSLAFASTNLLSMLSFLAMS